MSRTSRVRQRINASSVDARIKKHPAVTRPRGVLSRMIGETYSSVSSKEESSSSDELIASSVSVESAGVAVRRTFEA
jgi:hypothetical protein